MSTKNVTPEDLYGMSDDEIMNLDPSSVVPEPVSDEAPKDVADEAQAEEGKTSEGAEEEGKDTEKTTDTGKESTEDASDEAEKGENAEATKKADSQPAENAEKPAEKSGEIDYKAEYEKLLRPFKANGKEISVDSVDDAIALMQMGANYNKKMAGLKPSLKILKLLENNNLLNEEKLNFLIDLDKKNPDAITKLLKDSEIDPLDLDLKKQNDYKPTARDLDERQLRLEETLETIQDSTYFPKVVNLVQKQWDDKSKQVIYNNPEILNVIHTHMANGVYDIISARMEKERLFGRLQGMSDIEAYRFVGDAIQNQGGFNHIAQKQGNKPNQNLNNASEQKKAADVRREEKRNAAGITAAAPKAAKQPDFNPLALSDEDFSKLTAKQFF